MIQYKYKERKSKWLAPFILLFVFSSIFAQNNGNKSKKDLENKKKRITEEINQINSMLNETKASKKSSIGALVNINMKIEKRQELINTIKAQLDELNADIRKNEQKSETLKKNLEKLKAEYARMIIIAQRYQDSYSKLMFIFASSSFNQAYARLKYFQQYSEFRKKQAKEILETQTLLIANLNELKEQRHEKKRVVGN